MEIGRQVAILRRWFLVLVGAALLAGVAGYAFASSRPQEYEASAVLSVGGTTPSSEYNDRLVARELAFEFAALTDTQVVQDAAAAQMGLSELPGTVEATVSQVGARLTVKVVADEPDTAANVANATAAELVRISGGTEGNQALDAELAAQALAVIRSQIREVQSEIGRIQALPLPLSIADTAALDGFRVRLVDLWSTYSDLLAISRDEATGTLVMLQPAAPATSSTTPNPFFFALMAAVAGLLAAAAFVAVVEYLHPSIRDPAEVEEATGLLTLGAIDEKRGDISRSGPERLVTFGQPFSPRAEAYRTLRARVDRAFGARNLRVLLVTSAAPTPGQASIAANLAIAFAQSDRRVLLMDADLRQPTLHEIIGVANTVGLTSVLQAPDLQVESVLEASQFASQQNNLTFLLSGPTASNPSELIASGRMNGLIGHIQTRYDLIIVNSPPMGSVSDALVLSAIAQRTLLVVDPSSSDRSAVQNAVQTLAAFDASLLGTVYYRQRFGVTRGARNASAHKEPQAKDGLEQPRAG